MVNSEIGLPDYKTRLYSCWENMKRRCFDPNNHAYNRYGGRGIDVCKEWSEDFSNFKAWSLKNGYSDELSLDRINNDGDYSPENCRWTTWKVQQNNRSNNHRVEFKGKEKSISEWAEYFGVEAKNLYQRIERGLSLQEAIRHEVVPKFKMEIEGIGRLIKQHRTELGLSQREYGLLIDSTKWAVSSWERGVSNPGVDKMRKLINEHNFNATDLKYVDGTEVPPIWSRESGIPESGVLEVDTE